MTAWIAKFIGHVKKVLYKPANDEARMGRATIVGFILLPFVFAASMAIYVMFFSK